MALSRHTKISKFLSFALRHHPEKFGLQPDTGGWVDVAALLHACKSHGMALLPEELKTIVEQNDKKRFSLSADCTLIRANQGHTIAVTSACSRKRRQLCCITVQPSGFCHQS